MGIGLLGRKIGMTRLFDENGSAVPVTVIEAGPCPVIQVKTADKEGYDAVQLGFLAKRDSLLKKPEYYHFKANGVDPVHHVSEFRTDSGSDLKSGDNVTVDQFEEGAKVMVSGMSKGRGFQGVMKRHNFGGARASHGAHKNHRRPGAVGNASDPSRIFKNKKMPGHMGSETVTVKNLSVIKIDTDKNLIMVKGPVPGHRGCLLRIMSK